MIFIALSSQYLEDRQLVRVRQVQKRTSPYYEAFLIQRATGRPDLAKTFQDLREYAPDQFKDALQYLADSGVELDKANHIDANTIQDCLECCEDTTDRIGYDKTPVGENIEITRRGILIKDAEIKGKLDLSGLHFDRPLSFEGCTFDSNLDIASARLGPLSLRGSVFKTPPISERRLARGREEAPKAHGVSGSQVHIKGDLNCAGLTAGFVEFHGATIDGIAYLGGVEIGPNNPELGAAVDFSGTSMKVLMLRDGAKIVGGVNIIACTAQEIDLTASEIHAHEGSFAILARSIHVMSLFDLSGKILIDPANKQRTFYPTRIYGACYFPDAKIGGDLRLRGAEIYATDAKDTEGKDVRLDGVRFEHEKAYFDSALVFANSEIGGSVFMQKVDLIEPKRVVHTDGRPCTQEDGYFITNGQIDFRGVDIGGDFRLEGAKASLCNMIHSENRRLLDLRNSSAKRMFVFTNLHQECKGLIDLREASCAVYRDDFFSSKTWPRDLKFLLVGFEYDAFAVRDNSTQHRSRKHTSNSRRAGANNVMALGGKSRIRWLKQQPSRWLREEFQPQPWVQCAKVLRDMGYERDAHKLMFEREKRTIAWRNNNTGFMEKLVRAPIVLLCGHGHKMHRLALLSLLVLVIGAAVSSVMNQANLIRPTNVRVLSSPEYITSGKIPVAYSPFHPAFFSLVEFLPTAPAPGRGEWATCTRKQILRAAEEFQTGGYRAACAPIACKITDGKRDCALVSHTQHRLFGLLPYVRYDVTSNIAWLNKRLSFDAGPFRAKLTPVIRNAINDLFSLGAGAFIMMLVNFSGIIVSLLLATYATGALKRRD